MTFIVPRFDTEHERSSVAACPGKGIGLYKGQCAAHIYYVDVYVMGGQSIWFYPISPVVI